jgi:hypothetical protein
MEFHQNQAANEGPRPEPATSGDTTTATLVTANLRKKANAGEMLPQIRTMLGGMDSLLTKCYNQGDFRIFAPYLRYEDATATRAALELIRRQSYRLDSALSHAEQEHANQLRAEIRRMLGQPEGASE